MFKWSPSGQLVQVMAEAEQAAQPESQRSQVLMFGVSFWNQPGTRQSIQVLAVTLRYWSVWQLVHFVAVTEQVRHPGSQGLQTAPAGASVVVNQPIWVQATQVEADWLR